MNILWKVVDTFSRSYIEPLDCDASMDNLKSLLEELKKVVPSSLLNTLSVRHELKRQLLAIRSYRNVCMSKTPDAEQQRKRIHRALLKMYSNFEHL